MKSQLHFTVSKMKHQLGAEMLKASPMRIQHQWKCVMEFASGQSTKKMLGQMKRAAVAVRL